MPFENLNKYITDPTVLSILVLVKELQASKEHDLVCLVCEHFLQKQLIARVNLLPADEYSVLNPYAVSLYYTGKYSESIKVFQSLLLFGRPLTEIQRSSLLKNMNYSIPKVMDECETYNKDKILAFKEYLEPENFRICHGTTGAMHEKTERIQTKVATDGVIITMTTCKRMMLFIRTVSSFLNNCTDLERIKGWYVIDDNTNDHERKIMKQQFPFITFYWKDSVEEKGHANSMNIIRDLVLQTPQGVKYLEDLDYPYSARDDLKNIKYVLHLEDDWTFVTKAPYISQSIAILETDEKMGQCLFNVSYCETGNDFDVYRGQMRIANVNTIGIIEDVEELPPVSYYIHEYLPNGVQQKHCAYWPNYSLRPGVWKVDFLRDCGPFATDAKHFEMDYAFLYTRRGWKTSYFATITCTHTGKLTSETDDTKPNSYTLNGTTQFKQDVPKNLTVVELVNQNGFTFELVSDLVASEHEVFIISTNREEELKPWEEVFKKFASKDWDVIVVLIKEELTRTREAQLWLCENDFDSFVCSRKGLTRLINTGHWTNTKDALHRLVVWEIPK